MVRVVPHDPTWTAAFERIRARILEGFAGPPAGPPVTVEHVGSTAVPGLVAKPILDIDVVVRAGEDAPAAIEALARLGYEHRGDLGVPGREAFAAQADGEAARHLYLVVAGNQAYLDHIDFRDHLRAQPEVAAAYGALKLELGARFPTDERADREAYTEAKADFIQQALAAAREARQK